RHSRRLAHAPGVAAALLVAVCMLVVFSASSGAAAGNRNSPMSRARSNETGIQHLRFPTAPIKVLPGRNAAKLVTATGTRSRPLLAGSWHGARGAYTSIEAAVDEAKPGDWILVGPGDYHESPGSRDGVRITTPNIHLRGLTRSGVIVDGTRQGAPKPCDPRARWQNLGPGRAGRNGIVITASGVSVENLTVCNFVGGKQGRQVAFDGGFGTGKVGLGSFEGSYLTATSTFASRSQPALWGIFVSSTRGPGSIKHSFA